MVRYYRNGKKKIKNILTFDDEMKRRNAARYHVCLGANVCPKQPKMMTKKEKEERRCWSHYKNDELCVSCEMIEHQQQQQQQRNDPK